jgi:ribosome maturation factor RimP
MTDSPVLQRVRDLVEPIASDLGLDLYDLEQRGGTLRVTIDTPPGSEGGVDMDKLALATRLISREMDHHDPMPGRYTLEVTSPGVERTLRTPAHFQREIGKSINVRVADTTEGQRRFEGVLVAADDTTATLRLDDADLTEHVISLADIDRARTVFVWGPQPKPGSKAASKKKSTKKKSSQPSQSGAQQPSDSKKESS